MNSNNPFTRRIYESGCQHHADGVWYMFRDSGLWCHEDNVAECLERIQGEIPGTDQELAMARECLASI